MALFYLLQMLWEIGYLSPFLISLKDGIVIFLHIIEDH